MIVRTSLHGDSSPEEYVATCYRAVACLACLQDTSRHKLFHQGKEQPIAPLGRHDVNSDWQLLYFIGDGRDGWSFAHCQASVIDMDAGCNATYKEAHSLDLPRMDLLD